jgi:hypothetical protein
MIAVGARSLMLFRFALREGDWRLAGRLAALLAGERSGREGLRRELALAALDVRPAPISLAALRVLDRVTRLLRPR